MNEDRKMTESTGFYAKVDLEYRKFYGRRGLVAPPVSPAGFLEDPEMDEWMERYL